MHEQTEFICARDYEAASNTIWNDPATRPASSGSASDLAELVAKTCGLGPVLDAGCGSGALVRALVTRGFEARGIDIALSAFAEQEPGLSGRISQANILELPFADASFDTVVADGSLEFLEEVDLPRALSEMTRVSRRYVILRIASGEAAPGPWRRIVKGRAFWESECFKAGLRKHPLFYGVNAYESLDHEGAEILIPLEKIPAAANARYPLSALRKERDLYMDMLREHGSRSDAHVARYHFAARYIRPGDHVLDAACGLGYGSYVIHKSTQCGRVAGIDGCAHGVNYAAANFGLADKVVYVDGFLPDCLAEIPSNSVDAVLSFETLERAEAPEALLREFHRILTPGGRLIASVPHDWSDDTGQDPNPYHLHVYDRKKFVAQLGSKFDIEGLFAQTADRIKKPGGDGEWLMRPRALAEIDPEPADAPVEAEWLLAVACKSPLNGADVPYEDRVFTAGEREASGNALAFARDYENPWLVRSMVSIGLRTEKAHLREKWALGAVQQSSPFSADRGAALCILGYMSLEGEVGMTRHALMEAIDGYLAAEPANPNALRWQVSLRFVRGLIELSKGERNAAARYFQHVIDSPSAQYSPTLLTKTAEAALLLGSIRAADGDIEGARAIWQTTYRGILTAVADHLRTPYRTDPPKFELREIASVVLLAGRLATASTNASELSDRPAVFQQQSADDVARHIAHLELGKAWLESAWRATIAENKEKQAYLMQLVQGKDWLEGQWRRSQSRTEDLEALVKAQDDAFAQRIADLDQRHAEKIHHLTQQHGEALAASERRHDEAQAALQRRHEEAQAALERRHHETQAALDRSHHEEQAARDRSYGDSMAALQSQNDALLEANRQLEAHLRETQARLNRLEASLPVRVARKLGMRDDR